MYLYRYADLYNNVAEKKKSNLFFHDIEMQVQTMSRQDNNNNQVSSKLGEKSIFVE